ncbi:MAG: U32 family peptidase C-terminal domain-containing protein [Cyanobacteria bacterium HKST-UBA05]|nr:U32 family peptidase C-terminal domain-containing protein [Cyanobacteria bacterium HKST-UBA05]
MPSSLTPPELLLPAGDPVKLRYALAYGADAVYFGLAMASLRTPKVKPGQGPQFTPANLPQAISDCHAQGAKAYVTLNIFAANHDLKRIIPHLEQLEDLRPDALIISDPGIIRLAKRHAPSLPIHLSTQANTLNVSACAFWQDLGIERVILAREVPVREMAQIHDELPDLELECFVHGSLCVAYSGRCVISDYLTDNSKNSNKGMCGNSCRWEYENATLQVNETSRPDTVYTFEEDAHGSYMLNSKDLCLLRFLPELMDAGICSFKVEGRTKGIHYVATVGQVYRQAIDTLCAGRSVSTEQWDLWESALKQSANRGFTEGFLHGKPGSNGYTYETSKSRSIATFVAAATGLSDDQGRVQLEGRNPFSTTDALEWLTPNGIIPMPTSPIVDIDGRHVEQVHPNHLVWVTPPPTIDQAMVRWSLVRRIEDRQAGVACTADGLS